MDFISHKKYIFHIILLEKLLSVRILIIVLNICAIISYFLQFVPILLRDNQCQIFKKSICCSNEN